MGREKVREYARAINDESLLQTTDSDDFSASLTFMAIFGLQAQMAFFQHAGIAITGEKMVRVEQGLNFVKRTSAGKRCRRST